MNSTNGSPLVSMNPPQRTLIKPVKVYGKPFDPTAPQNAYFEVEPSDQSGIVFEVEGVQIPYNSDNVHAMDSGLGRMLILSHPDHDFQVFLLEHLAGALRVMGLDNGIKIKIGKSCKGWLTSSKMPFFGFKKDTYWIPVTGPGIEGFVKQLLTYCVNTGAERRIITVTGRHVHEIIDPKWNLHRSMTIEECDTFRIRVISALQPDMPNCPKSQPIEIGENDIANFLHARAMMRLSSTHKDPFKRLLISLALQSLLWGFNIGSSGMTHETYIRARYLHKKEDVIGLMGPEFQEGADEHLYHNGLDLLGELLHILQGVDFHGKITLENTNHVFRMDALGKLMPQILCK